MYVPLLSTGGSLLTLIIYTNWCTHTCTHTHVHVHTYVSIMHFSSIHIILDVCRDRFLSMYVIFVSYSTLKFFQFHHFPTNQYDHMHTHACMHAHTQTHAHTHACTHTHTHARAHTRMHAHTHACTRTHTHTRAHTHTHTHTHTHIHLNVHYHPTQQWRERRTVREVPVHWGLSTLWPPDTDLRGSEAQWLPAVASETQQDLRM